MLEYLLQGLFFIVMVVVSAVVFALIYIRLMQGAFSGKRAWPGRCWSGKCFMSRISWISWAGTRRGC
jgi:hypothetical protein